PLQNNPPPHHPSRRPAAVVHPRANLVLSTRGTGYSGEGQGEQDCHGNESYVRPSCPSYSAAILSSQHASSAQTDPNYLMLFTGCRVGLQWFTKSGRNRSLSALISNLPGSAGRPV